MNTSLEVAIAGQYAAPDELIGPDGLIDGAIQRSGIADACRAAKADDIETQRIQIVE